MLFMPPSFRDLFPNPKPIIGMIHLAGASPRERLERAYAELQIYQSEGVDGAIIEDYHGSFEDLVRVLSDSRFAKLELVIGINYLASPFDSQALASVSRHARFVQYDDIQTLDEEESVKYDLRRGSYPRLAVFGGVRFKGNRPTGRPLEQDIKRAMGRCEAIVTTGSGTGIETPLIKLQEFRALMGDFPLIVGAGVTAENVARQLEYADGAIVGSYFKPDGNTELPVDRTRVKDLMDVVKQLRRN